MAASSMHHDAVVKWIISPEATAQSVELYMERVETRLLLEMQRVAQDIEAWAKSNHPWNNITGAAEAGLNCRAEFTGAGVKITLAHGVDYGIWLEVKFAGKWGVIEKAMSAHYGDIMAAMGRALMA